MSNLAIPNTLVIPPITKKLIKCFWCEVYLLPEEITKDHITPLGQGGHESGRVEITCKPCNNERGKLTGYHCRIKKISKRLLEIKLIFPRSMTNIYAFNSNERNLMKSVLGIRKCHQQMLNLQAKWRLLEMGKLGYAPTGDLIFDVP